MDLNPAVVIAEHGNHISYGPYCVVGFGSPLETRCLPYRLAKALAASEAKVAQCNGRHWVDVTEEDWEW